MTDQAHVLAALDAPPLVIENASALLRDPATEAALLVAGVAALFGNVFRQVMQKVAYIVKQRGGNQFVVRAGLLGQMGALQGVFRFSDKLAEIGTLAFGPEKTKNLVDDRHKLSKEVMDGVRRVAG